MLSHKIFRANGMMTAGWLVIAACGGSGSNGGTTGGAAGGATGGAAGSATTGSGGSTGTAGTGTGGMPPVNDAGRVACGTANNGTGCNPNGNTRICDLANNRCVQCTSNSDCTANPMRMGTPFCDTVGLNGAGLPNDTCEACLTDAQCGAGMVCLNNNCRLNCTTDAQCAAVNPMTPVCNTAVMPGQCVQCLNDTQCAGVTDNNGVPRPHCRLPMTNGANQCRACNTSADCQPGQVCSQGGNCNNPPPDGGGGPPVDASSGG